MTHPSRTSSDPLTSTAQGAGPQLVPPLLPTGPILLWLIVQAAALAIAALRIPLWAQPPAAQELLALRFVTLVQIGASSMLFSMLMRTLPTTIVTIAASWPMIALAGFLGAADVRTIILFGNYVTIWLAVLALLRAASWGTPFDMVAVAAITLWVIGGPILLFAGLEYGSNAEAPGMQYMLGPIVAIASETCGPGVKEWVSIGILGVVAALLALGRFLLQRRYSARRL